MLYWLFWSCFIERHIHTHNRQFWKVHLGRFVFLEGELKTYSMGGKIFFFFMFYLKSFRSDKLFVLMVTVTSTFDLNIRRGCLLGMANHPAKFKNCRRVLQATLRRFYDGLTCAKLYAPNFSNGDIIIIKL